MGVPFFGDYDTTETVIIPFNTFSSDDPSASVTVTNLVAGDVEIHKDGSTTQRASDSGVTVTINFDSVTGNHIVSIDLSDNSDAGYYANGSRYQVRIEGVTIDSGTVNAWIGAFSIGCTLRPTTAGRTLDVESGGCAGCDWGNVANKNTANDLSATDIQLCDTVTTNTDMRGTDSAALATGVDVTKIHGTALTETSAGNLADNFTTFYDNADAATAKTVDDVGGASGLEVDVTKIHGTALTETSAGNLAGNFSTFYDNGDAATANIVDNVGGASGGGSPLVMGRGDVGDFKENGVVYFHWNTIDRSGAAVAPSTAGTIKVYKDDGTGEVTTPTGITDTRAHDGTTGVHQCKIDLNNSLNSFYEKGKNYTVELVGAVIDTKTVNAVIASFSIENRWANVHYHYE